MADIRIIQLYLERLKSAKAEYAHNVLRSPPKETEYGFGQVCGVYEGFLRAEQLLEDVIGEEDDRT